MSDFRKMSDFGTGFSAFWTLSRYWITGLPVKPDAPWKAGHFGILDFEIQIWEGY